MPFTALWQAFIAAFQAGMMPNVKGGDVSLGTTTRFGAPSLVWPLGGKLDLMMQVPFQALAVGR